MPDTEMSPARTARRQRSAGKAAKADAAAAQETSLTSVAGTPGEITLGGRTFPLLPLTFNDLVVCERTFGDVETLLVGVAAQKPSAIRAFAWLMLRKSEPDLTEEQVGELLPIHQDTMLVSLASMLVASGAFDAKQEAESGRPPAAPTGSATLGS